jgi:hypothetical protein
MSKGKTELCIFHSRRPICNLERRENPRIGAMVPLGRAKRVPKNRDNLKPPFSVMKSIHNPQSTIRNRPTVRRFFAILGIITISTAVCAGSALAVSTSIWEQQSQQDFEAGSSENVSVTNLGEVMLAPNIDTFFENTKEVYIWCLAEDSKGNIYAGSGNEGKIYKITPDGQSSLFYDSPEVSILSLAIDKNDTLYAGTAPDGLIYKITSSTTPPETILSSEDKYIWALTFDDAGNLYAATGTDGKIYKITPDGKTDVLYDSEESNIMCLLYHQNTLYAGSEGKGIIYKIAADGTATVIRQTSEKEVHALRADSKGNIYAAAITSAPPQPGSRPTGPPPPGGGPPEENKSYIYQIRPDGVISKIWESPEPMILSMVVEPDNQLLVGTGDKGKLYRVKPDGDFVALGKTDASQVITMHRTASTNRLLLATGNSGKILELKTDYVAEGTLESEAHNTSGLSQWGKLSWENASDDGTAIVFSTRSGNTSKPDSTWSDWSEELTTPEGSQITSPPAQYIQWRATLKTSNSAATSMLKKVSIASAQSNIEPRFQSIDIRKGGEAKKGSGPPTGRPSANRAQQNTEDSSKEWTIQWKVSDANKDTLQFTVYYRGVDETNWKLLKKELSETNYAWDTTSMPDGRYLIKVAATDKLSNPVGWAKWSEKVSQTFDIDNTQPTVQNIVATANGNGTYKISCSVEDGMSYIQKAVYKIDSDEHWKVIFPGDGIFDSKREDLLLETESLPNGAHTITIQVTDAAGNTAVGRGNF